MAKGLRSKIKRFWRTKWRKEVGKPVSDARDKRSAELMKRTLSLQEGKEGDSIDSLRAALAGEAVPVKEKAAVGAEAEADEVMPGISRDLLIDRPKRFNFMNHGDMKKPVPDLAAVPSVESRRKFIADQDGEEVEEDAEEDEDVEMGTRSSYGKAERGRKKSRRAKRAAAPGL